MDATRTKRFLIIEDDAQYASWLKHAVSTGWPADEIVTMDWTSFGRVRTGMTVRDYDIVMLALKFDEFVEEPTNDSFDWIRRLRSQPNFPEMIVLAEGGSELVAIRTLRLGAADYLPKRLVTPPRLQRSIKLTLRAMEKDAQRRAERQAQAGAGKPSTPAAAPDPHVTTHAGVTQAGAALAKAAQAALAMPAKAPSAPTPISTHTGRNLAQAARAALTSVPS